MTLGSMDADRFVRALAEENAQLRALVASKNTLPPSPPTTATDCSEPITPVDALPDPLLKLKLPAKSAEDEDISPLRTIIELLRVQIASQAAAQDQLLDQLGELRSSHANLQAATSDVTDELVVLREKSARLASEVEAEREQRKTLEEEKAAEADKVATLRSKIEESRRAIMRLQDETAARRASESRRGSAVLLSTPLLNERRGSASAAMTPGSVVLEHRRASLMAAGVPPLPGPIRRASIAVCDTIGNGSAQASPGVGLGLELPSQTPRLESPRTTKVGHHRRAASTASAGLFKGGEAPLDERLTSMRGSQRSSSMATDGLDRRRSSLAPLAEGPSMPISVVRRPGSLSLVGRPPAARSSISALPDLRRRSMNASIKPTTLAGAITPGEEASDESAMLRAQLEALQRRLAEVEAAPRAIRTLHEHALSDSPPLDGANTPGYATAPASRRPSAAVAFGSFSFQSHGRNPALLDTPPSPSGGYSPGGSRRDGDEDLGPFGNSARKMIIEASVESASESDSGESVKTTKAEVLTSLMARCESAEAAVGEEAGSAQ